jgi:Mrp family chromosome partitioning ATPase
MKHDPKLTHLLLLNLRDGGYEDKIKLYPDKLVLEHKARLIDEGFATGVSIKDGIHLAFVKGLQISTSGHRWLENLETSEAATFREASIVEPMPEMKNSKLVFVSHSSVDEDIAEALVDLLCTALPLRRADFRCTSVAGAQLGGGDITDDRLRREIREAPAFLSLITKQSFASTYVLFELGARWGSGQPHIPLLAKGAGVEVLKEPLKATNALQLNDENNVLQLVHDLAGILGRKSEPPHSYINKVRKVVEISIAGVASQSLETKERLTIDQIERLPKVPLIMTIPQIGKNWNEANSLSWFYTGLRDRLLVYFEVRNVTHKPKLVAVTSCNKGAGVSSIAAGLAATLSETSDGNVLLVDMNPDQQVMQRFRKGKLAAGLASALDPETKNDNLVQEKLYVVTEWAENEKQFRYLPKRFSELVPKLKASDYDYIIFDMPPVSPTSVTPRLAGLMDMVLLVIESEKTNQDVVRKVTALLEESKANVNVVLNKNNW